MTDPILIVGAGPTGLTAALELRRFGLAVRLIDKAEGPATTSRALGIQARTLELLEQRRLVDEILKLGNPAHYGSIYGDGERLVRVDFRTARSRYNYLMMLSQAETERILRGAVAAAGVEIEWGVAMVALAQDVLSHDENKATAILRRKDGSLESIATPWVISAEGAHSRVRSTLNLDFKGVTVHRQYMLGDVRVDGDLSADDFHIFGSTNGFMALFPLAKGHFRLIADNPAHGRHEGEPTLAELQDIYDKRSSIPAKFHDMTWSSWFAINSRMVDRLQEGRMFLGGDAAHIHAPAGAQGMNTGIQDMINLGWKLALVTKGQAPAALLDTYSEERILVIRNVLKRTEEINDLTGARNSVFRAVFDHVAPFVGGLGAVQSGVANHIAQLEFGYGHSALSENHHASGALKAGERAPEVEVFYRGEGWTPGRLLERLDPSAFTLVVAHGGAADRLDPALGEVVSKGNLPIRIVETAPARDEVYAPTFGERGDVYLVRPDGYVALTASPRAAPEALRAWIAKWSSPENTAPSR